MALYTYRSQQDMAKMLNAPKYNPKSEMMWNTLNGNTDSQPANQTEDNFFVKRGKSIENALGTTGATAVGGINELIVNENRNNTMKDQKTRMNDIAKKYGFNTYQDVWDARDKAEAEGDTKTLDLINNTINPELQAQATANKNEMDKFASDYKDYVKNDYIGKKTNQDRGKFLGSAMNTMSTIADVMMPTAGIAFNAGQGAWEGFADELEQNGLENFDFERAKNNALAGAASGALVGAVNKGISGSLAKNGGNLFKGGNKLTAGLNNLGANTALGRGVSTLATGATRGAISGAVGGATGAGVSSALKGENLGQGVANALQGAVQGAQAGFGTGAVMTGANMALNSAKNRVVGNQTNPVDNRPIDSTEQAPTANTLDNIVKPVAEDSINGTKPTINNNAQAPLQTSQTTNSQWDKLAQENGFDNYNDAVQKFKQANPNVEANANNVTDFMDSNLNENKKTFSQAKSGNTIKNERAIQEEIMNQFNPVGQPTVRATKPRETFQSLYKDMGLSDADQIRTAVHYAEPGELVPTMIREAAGRAGVVDLADAQSLVRDLRLNKRQNYNKTLNVVEDIIDSTPSTISGGKNGVDALQLQRAIEQAASDALGSNGTYHIGNNLVDAVTAQNLYRVSTLIGENLDKAVAENNGVAYVQNKYAKEIAEMRNSQPNNPKWQSFVDNEIAGAKSIKQLRSGIKNLTRASIYIEDGDNRYGTIGSSVSRQGNVPTSKTGVINRAVNTAYEKVYSSPTARNMRLARAERNIAKESSAAKQTNLPPVNDVVEAEVVDITPVKANTATQNTAQTPVVTNNSATYNPATQVYNAIGRTEGLTNAEQQNTANYLTDAVQRQNNGTLESLVVPNTGTSTTGVYNSMTGTPASTGTVNASNSYFPATGDYWTDIIGSAMSKAIDANDAEAFGTLYSMYQQALSKNQSTEKDMTNPLNWSTTDRKSLLQAQNGLSQIDSLENSYRNAVGDEGGNVIQGTLRGWANNLSGGNLDPSAENYVKQANSIGAGIIKNLVNLGSTEYDAQRYIDYLPKLTDTKEQAAQKLQVLRTEYQNVIDNLRALYGA